MGGKQMDSVSTNNNNEPWSFWWALLIFLAAWGITSMLFGCKTKTVVVPKVQTQYVHNTDTIHDSVYNYVTVREYKDGDTMYRIKTEYKYKLVYKAKTDTLLKRDSIPYVVTKEIATSVKVGWFDKIKMWMFFPLLIIIGIMGVYIIIRR